MPESVPIAGLEVAYTRQGEGPPLVLLHGAEASHAMFADLVPLLAPHFTVIAYDQRDCGASAASPIPATLDDLADDAHALLRALGYDRVHVFGTSFGGKLAQKLALKHPACVARLALASTWPLSVSYAQVNPHADRLRALRSQLPHRAVELAGWFFPPAELSRRPEWLTLFAHADAASERSRSRARTVASPTTGDVADIAAPTLLIAGEADRVVPPQATLSMAQRIRQARCAVLPGVGHVAAIQAPERLAPHLIDFFLDPSRKDPR